MSRENLILVRYINIIIDYLAYIRGNTRYLACAKTRLLSMENSVTEGLVKWHGDHFKLGAFSPAHRLSASRGNLSDRSYIITFSAIALACTTNYTRAFKNRSEGI